jgi:hypothetical protein
MKIFNFILEGYEADLKKAEEQARGQNWQEMETTENDSLPYLDYKNEINGIEIWYCYAGDFYIFTKA